MNSLSNALPCGFVYDLALRRHEDGAIVSRERLHNRVPSEGLDLMASACFKGAAMPANLFIGLYAGSYVPTGNETAATLPNLVNEVTQYDGTTRKPWEPGAVAAGGVSNELSLARFSFISQQTVNGVFISSSSGKGSNTGTLLSIVRLPVERAVDPAFYLEILAGFQFISVS